MATDEFVNDIMRIVVSKAIEIAPSVGIDPAELREDFKRTHPEWLYLPNNSGIWIRKDELQ